MSILIKNALLSNEIKDIYIKGNIINKIDSKINAKADNIIDAMSKAVLPSFLNLHTHAAMNLFRSYADDMKLEDWLKKKIWPVEARLTEDDVYWGAKFACLEMIKSGTAFFNDMYWHYGATARAADEMGLRANISAVFIDMFDNQKAKEQIERNEKLFIQSQQYSNRINFALGPHSIYTVSEKSLLWAKKFADKHNLMIHIHLSETEKEADDCIKKRKKRPVEYLEDIGFLGDNVIAAHCIHANDKEIKILKKYNVCVVYNPVSNMKLCSGVFPYEKMKNAGVNICLGTDGCASNNNLDMLEEMKFASLLQKSYSRNPVALPAKDCFKMAAINPAKAFGLNCGRIEEGALADLILVDLKDLNLNPNHNLVSNLVYSANGTCVDTTICNGKILMHNRKVEGEEEILRKANEVAFRLTANKSA
ncbi:MAG: amidohydrolase [Candidatus Nanohalarchaeota archaeon]|nr:MAG: amidohydrolase [Candidatus Nanohaloarchaeota archaeon]